MGFFTHLTCRGSFATVRAWRFQNGIQNCCHTTGVIPLLTKRKAVKDANYSGWFNRIEAPLESRGAALQNTH